MIKMWHYRCYVNKPVNIVTMVTSLPIRGYTVIDFYLT